MDGATQTQPLTVLKDPNSAGTEADIAQQIALLRKIRDDVEPGRPGGEQGRGACVCSFAPWPASPATRR